MNNLGNCVCIIPNFLIHNNILFYLLKPNFFNKN